MMNPIVSYDNIKKENVLMYTQSLIKSMEEYGLGATWQIEKLKEINENLYNKFCEKARSQYSKLNDRYPGIVNMVLNYGRDFDLPRLAKMLGLAEQLENGEIPELETHVEISTQLRNEFVLPKLNLREEDVEKVDISKIDPEKLKNMDFSQTNIKL
jgi:hypothetical protein